MENRKLVAEPRTRIGSGESGRLRREGWIPAVVYGPGEDAMSIKVPTVEIETMLRQVGGEKLLIDMKIGKHTKLVTLQEVQRDPVSGKIIHADFLVLHKGQEVELDVPVVVSGTAPGVKKGGVLEIITRQITVKAIPKNIPSHIEIDVSEMEMGDVIHVRDLSVPDVQVVNDPDEPVITILTPRAVAAEAAEEAEEIEEEVEGEEGEAQETQE